MRCFQEQHHEQRHRVQLVPASVQVSGATLNGLTRKHPRERVLTAIAEAHARQHFRYQTIRQLVERTPPRPAPALRSADPAIRPMTQYTLEDFLT